MKKRFAALLLLGWLIPASMAWAECPIVISHTLTGYTMGTDAVTLSYILHVKNVGTNSISNIELSDVPLRIISTERITLNIGALDAQTEVQIPFTLTTPMLLSESEFSSQPLFWAGICMDSSGSLIEFPASSVEGGVL